MFGEKPFEMPFDPSGPLLLHVFATRSDDYVGQTTLLKVLSGTLNVDDTLLNNRTHATRNGGTAGPAPRIRAGPRVQPYAIKRGERRPMCAVG